ncbi:CYTH domain-containing protein [Alteromonas lipolytica]|uniref:CYTH domain-containing protein n=1 Tax=Alteromonas lipolytica TaxID=1856405 RepID=A0A1E8FD13_9ALTE|nr:CYTH domain-containing protein [Alteromonas lipolytica]OFI33827.1 hypothetical protein BFC17_19860 [Alteromonas lipolytica]GGF68040.1 hypothetical protein GCM10011338_20310 [Alteromonas lipolytica]
MRADWEIERKFVVNYLPEGLLETRNPVSVRQGYIAAEGERHVRIRDEGGKYSMTIKQGFGLKRMDTRIMLSAEQFNELWPLTQHMRVEKKRYRIDFFGHRLVLDVFTGHLAPLVLVEVEFDSEVHSRQFLPPDFAELEVTHRREYQNVNLARMGLPDSLAMANAY